MKLFIPPTDFQVVKNPWIKLLLAVFSTGIGLFCLFLSFLKYQTAMNAKTWPTVEATVLSSTIQTDRSDKTTKYSERIIYSYIVNGKTYRNGTYGLIKRASSNRDTYAARVNAYPKGKQFPLYVNPTNPHESYIDIQPRQLLVPCLAAFAFTMIGVILLGIIIYKRHKRLKQKRILASDIYSNHDLRI